MNQKGFILPVVLILSALLTGTALAWAGRQFHAYNRSILNFTRLKAIHAARSGVEWARFRLEMDSRDIDGPGDMWYDPMTFRVGEMTVTVSVEDEQSKLNINALVYPSGELNRRISEIADGLITRPRREAITRFLRREGVCRSFRSTGSLLRVPGFRAETQSLSAITVFGQGRININTASPELLEILVRSGGAECVAGIVREREREPFQSVFDLRSRSVMAETDYMAWFPILAVRSDVFSIHSSVKSETVSASTTMVIQRTGGKSVVLRYGEWMS
ncbi:general secretion pathway protein GspK [bacterium]|nr:general secretion pathway protein GspK [candidate division CSSED10-310 bacterium]